MTAEIICIGTELLLGDTVNTNATFAAGRLASLGISSYWQTVVGDNPARLKQILEVAFSRSDIVVFTGGLGPTYDDLTKETVADYFGLELELHEESYQHLVGLFEKFNRPMTENNKKQAYMPKGAIVFPNDRGTANGLAIEKNGKTAIMLPGPPREMTALFTNQVEPYLQKFTDTYLYSSSIYFFGIGESQLEQDLHDYMLEHDNPTIAPYASDGEVKLRVTASAKTEEEAKKLIELVVKEIVARYKDKVYGVDIGDLQTAVVLALKEKSLTISIAESCTGGLLSKRITEVSGSSDVFGYGVCTYANQAKIDLIGVSTKVLEQYGAVSEETAIEMARGIRERSNSSIGISTTGVAGPTGGTKEKPVGLVYVGISTETEEYAIKLLLSRGYGGERELIRYMAASHALHEVLTVIKTI